MQESGAAQENLVSEERHKSRRGLPPAYRGLCSLPHLSALPEPTGSSRSAEAEGPLVSSPWCTGSVLPGLCPLFPVAGKVRVSRKAGRSFSRHQVPCSWNFSSAGFPPGPRSSPMASPHLEHLPPGALLDLVPGHGGVSPVQTAGGFQLFSHGRVREGTTGTSGAGAACGGVSTPGS